MLPCVWHYLKMTILKKNIANIISKIAQPIVISLCGKGIIKDKEQWIERLKANENLSKALTLALFDNMSGGMRAACEPLYRPLGQKLP